MPKGGCHVAYVVEAPWQPTTRQPGKPHQPHQTGNPPPTDIGATHEPKLDQTTSQVTVMALDQKRAKPSIETLERRAQIVALARQGHSERAIAELVGLSKTAARYHLEAYRAELTPSSELAEEWRQQRLARADERFRKLGPLALADPPDYQALAALQKEEESITKMLGANLEVGVSLGLVTAEQFAALVGWSEQDLIEGTAVELPAGDA